MKTITVAFHLNCPLCHGAGFFTEYPSATGSWQTTFSRFLFQWLLGGFCQWNSEVSLLVGEETSILLVTLALPSSKNREESGSSLWLLSALPAPVFLGCLRAAKTAVLHSLTLMSCPFLKALSTSCLEFQFRSWALASATIIAYWTPSIFRQGAAS